tara:strand:+ start:205 stop:1314 length:1110 start_codon:yes stop_codon:yes gene_type:complete
MSQLKVNSIKGINVPASGPQIDIGNTGDINLNNSNVTNVTQATVTTANITTNNVTTENATTLNVTNEVDLSSADQFTVPVGTTAQRPSSPVVGTIRYNTTDGKPEYWTGSEWKGFTLQTYSAEFTATGSGNWQVPGGVSSVEALVVAGGGSGGSGTAGGGGAGGVVYSQSAPVPPGGSVPYNVGNGHPGGGREPGRGENGTNSVFGVITAYGGGGGGNTHPPSQGAGRPGGSGGGGASYNTGRHGRGAAQQPGTNPVGTDYGNPGAPSQHGGGGGAGAAGSLNTGGPGVTITVGENSYTVGGGGMGQSEAHVGPTGSQSGPPGGGGGTTGRQGLSGGNNQGGGGGGGWDYGSGIRGPGGPGYITVVYQN